MVYVWVYFDYDYVFVVGVYCELDIVVVCCYVDFMDDGEGLVVQLLVFYVVECLCGGYGDGVVCVYVYWVEVFDVGDDNYCVCCVVYYFQFVFFLVQDVFFQQYGGYGVVVQVVFCNCQEFFVGVCDVVVCVVEGKVGLDDDGQVDFFLVFYGFFYGVYYFVVCGFYVDFFYGGLEQFVVFVFFDGFYVCVDEFYVVFFEVVVFVQFYCQVQCCLFVQCGQNCVWFFFFDDFFYEFRCQWFQICCVGQFWVGYDGCWVGIDQNDVVVFVFQCFECLGVGIVEFGCLFNLDGVVVENQDGLEISMFRYFRRGV